MMGGISPTDAARLDAVPLHWRVMRLKHVARLQYGDGLPSTARRAGPVPVYGSNGIVGHHAEANTEAPVVLVGRKGSFGKVQISARPAFCIDTAFYVDRRHLGLGGAVDLGWLAYLLEGLRLDQLSQDTGVPGLSRELAHNMRVPVPPLAEQRRIARALDASCAAIDRLIAARRVRSTHLDALRAAVLHDGICGAGVDGPRRDAGVGWIGQVPRRWAVEPLKRQALLATGHTPSRSDASLWLKREIPFVSLADTRTLSTCSVISETEVMLSRAGLEASTARVLPAGTVVLTRDATIGLCAIIGRPMAVSQHLVGWIPGPGLRSAWLLHALEAMRPELRRLSLGATIATLGLPDLRRLRIPVPPVAEQDALVFEMRTRLTCIDALRTLTEAIVDQLGAVRRARIFEWTHGRGRATSASPVDP